MDDLSNQDQENEILIKETGDGLTSGERKCSTVSTGNDVKDKESNGFVETENKLANDCNKGDKISGEIRQYSTEITNDETDDTKKLLINEKAADTCLTVSETHTNNRNDFYVCLSDENENKVQSPTLSCDALSLSKVTFDCSPTKNENTSFKNSSKQRVDTTDCEKTEWGSCIRKPKQTWGWVVVFATWIVMIPLAGTLASFGTMLEPLTLEFNATKMEAGWLGSLSFGFTVGTCPFSTPLFSVFGGRKVAFVGVIGGAISLVITSFSPSLYLMYLTYSAMFGVFTNFVYNSGMSLTGQYFPNKNQALSTCLASAGISFGTLLINPLSEVLVSNYGWRNTMRILAGGVLFIGLGCVAFFKPVKTMEQKLHTKLKHIADEGGRKKLLEVACESNKALNKQVITDSLQNCNESKISLAAKEMRKNVLDKKMWDCSVCGNPATLMWMMGTLFWSLSFLFPLIFLIDYMFHNGIPTKQGAWVLTAYGISEFIGRLVCAVGVNRLKFSYAYVYAVTAGISGVATLFAPRATAIEFMYVYGIVIGVNSGVLNSMMFTTTMQFFGNDRGPHVWGYINVMLALGMIVGPVTAGAIYDISQSYVTAFYIGGGMFLLCAVTMLLIPISLKYFPVKSHEAKGKREKNIDENCNKGGKIVKERRISLRKITMMQQFQTSETGKKKWGKAANSHLEELKELHDSEEEIANSQVLNGNTPRTGRLLVNTEDQQVRNSV